MVTRDESSFQKIEEQQSIHQEDPQEENLEASSSYLYKEINELWITWNEVQTIELGIEEFIEDPLCIHDFEQVPQEKICAMIVEKNKKT